MQPSVWSVLQRRWNDTRERKGPIASAKEIAADVWDVVKESTPERRRSLFGDVEYDWDHQVNTTSGGVSHRTRLLAAISGAQYQPSEPGVFDEMLDALETDFAGFTFIDLGSGKGRTLLMAARYPFQKIIGVELLPELHHVALENIAKSQHSARIQSICMDARNYQFSSDPLVLYLFNPLPAAALQQVIENLRRSLEKCPRPVRVIYHNPISADVLSRSGFLRLLSVTHQYAIYSN